MAASLGVSVAPVRDAVNLLAAEGLVHVRPRRGTIVAPMSGDVVAELYEIREMIEPAAAERVAERATAPEIARVRWFAQQLESSPATGRDTVTDIDLYLAELSVDADFDAELVHAAGNRGLTTPGSGHMSSWRASTFQRCTAAGRIAAASTFASLQRSRLMTALAREPR